MLIALRRSARGRLASVAVVVVTVATLLPLTVVGTSAATDSDVFLHKAGMSLNNSAPVGGTAAENDAAGLNFAGGNPWKDAGAWTAAPSLASGSLVALSDLHVWVGLRNSDDQGTQFDVRADVYRNATLVSEGITRCITNVTRNAASALEVVVAFPAPTILTFNGTTDVLSIKLSARIGTTENGAKCTGPGGSHNNATGLRFYSDSTGRPARFDTSFIALATAVKINEVESSGGIPGDWVELINTSASTVDVSLHIFKDNVDNDPTHLYVIPSGTTIGPGGFLVLNELMAPPVGGQFSFGLGAGADSARFFAPDGTTLLDTFTWTQTTPTTFGRCPDGTGEFQLTTTVTKGTANDCSVLVRINEIESDAGSPDDWVELFNAGPNATSVAGFVLKDNDDAHSYTIPAGTTITAGGLLVLDTGTSFTFSLDAPDSVRLFNPSSALVDSFAWTTHATTTYGRCPNGSGAITTTASSTKGTVNDCGVQIRLNEVESDAGTPGDWVELYNAGPAAVNLTGYVLKDNAEVNPYVFPAGSSIGPGGFLVLNNGTDFLFGLGSSDSARLFDPSLALIDSFTWTSHAPVTYGRCPNGIGTFITNNVSTKGTTNFCPATWPGGTGVQTADGVSVFGGNMSGLTYEGSGSATPGVLWAVRNNVGLPPSPPAPPASALFRLVWNGTIWTPDPSNGWSVGKGLRYPTNGATENPDAEGVTFASSISGGLYISTERNNAVSGTSRNSVLLFDPNGAAPLVALHEWDLTSNLPVVGPNLGIEAITWVPDTFLTSRGFFDESKGHTYVPAEYPSHADGLFFVGLEANGNIYAYALNHADGTFTRIATISTGFVGVMALEFDRELNNFWAVCDDGCQGRSVVLEINGSGRYVVTRTFNGPAGLPSNMNNEGFAMATQAACVNNLKPAFWADDGDTGGHSIRQGTLQCSPF